MSVTETTIPAERISPAGNIPPVGIISHISRCSLHDGPGVRTVVYLKGCGLRCLWCHNPETLQRRKDILYASQKCIGCGECIRVCPQHHRAGEEHMIFDREGCEHCGRCAAVCPANALTVSGEEMTVEEVLREIRKDLSYYRESGGGVTLSGGECLLQPLFTAALLRACREEGIHTAIETALFVPWNHLEAVLPYVDLIFADLKLADSGKHRQYTGQGNERILENLQKLAAWIGAGQTMETERTGAERTGAERTGVMAKGVKVPQLIIRTPLIPGVNDNAEEMEALGRIIKTLGNAVTEAELLKYNYLAEGKYESLNQPYHSFGQATQSDEQVEELRERLNRSRGMHFTGRGC